MRRPKLFCGKYIPDRIEPETDKRPDNLGEACGNKFWRVLEEDKAGGALIDDASNAGPEPSIVFESAASSGDRERLAWEARSDDIHDPMPRAAVEGREIVPDRREIQGRVFHPRHEAGRRVRVDLNMTNSSVSPSQGKPESEVKAANSGTKSQAIHASSSAPARFAKRSLSLSIAAICASVGTIAKQ